MYIYGGFGGAKKTADITIQKQTYFMQDVWKYDIDTLVWTHIHPYCRDDRCPGVRRGHAAIYHHGTRSMYMFGGRKDFVPKKLADYIYESNLLVRNDMWG